MVKETDTPTPKKKKNPWLIAALIIGGLFLVLVVGLILLALLGIIAAFTIPKIVQSTVGAQAIAKMESVNSQLTQAQVEYQGQAKDASKPPLASKLAEGTGFVARTDNCQGQEPFVITVNCFQYGDGSVLAAENKLGANPNVLRFNFYPDGLDGQGQPISLRYHYSENQMSTWGIDSEVPSNDPIWAKRWVRRPDS